MMNFEGGSSSEVKLIVSTVAVGLVVSLLAHAEMVILLGGYECDRLVWGAFMGAVAERLVLGQSA